jgi:peptidoglycan/LPS O-acetylase OafA/YrhL
VKKREPFFDIVRGVAILAVIVIHLLYFYLKADPNSHSFLLHTLNNLLRFAVPWFLITSGVLLEKSLPDAKSWIKFYKKKINSLLPPYLIMTGIVTAAAGLPILTGLWYLATGGALIPYYFLVVLAQCYIVYPLFLLTNDNKKIFLCLFFISLASAITPQLWYLHHIPFAGQYFFFFFYGIYKRNELLEIDGKPPKTGTWLSILLITTMLYILFPAYLYNASFMYSIPLLHVFYSLSEKMKQNVRFVSLLAKFGENSLWIFLLHYPITYLVFIVCVKLQIPFLLKIILSSLVSISASFGLAVTVQTLYSKINKLILPR